MFGFFKKKKMEGTEDTTAASGAGAAVNTTVKFLCPKFKLGDKVYVSSELEAPAEAKDAEALNVIEQLIEMKSGVIEIVTPE